MNQADKNKSKRAVSKAVEECGGVAKLAARIKLSRQAVYNLVRGDSVISVGSAVKVAAQTSVTLSELRPDLNL